MTKAPPAPSRCDHVTHYGLILLLLHFFPLLLPTLFHPTHSPLTPQLSALLPALTPEGRKAALNDLTKWAKGLTLARRCE